MKRSSIIRSFKLSSIYLIIAVFALFSCKSGQKEQKEEKRKKGTVSKFQMVPTDARGTIQTKRQDKAQRSRTVEAHKVTVTNQ